MLAQRFVTTLSLLLAGFAMAQDVAPTPAPSFGSKEDPKIKTDKPSSNERLSLWSPSVWTSVKLPPVRKGRGR